MKTYLEWRLSDSVQGQVSQRTYDDYEQAVRLHIVSELGGLKLKDLTSAHLPTILTAIGRRFLTFHGGLATPCGEEKALGSP